jgi:nucleotidyltransferase substrate binding protein (TIGR01987 family)
MSVSFLEFEKALISLEKAIAEQMSDIVRDATIQRFEFCIELAWKVSKKSMGTSTASPKQVIREMAQSGYIDNIDIWLQALDQRNLSVHTYSEILAKEVHAFILSFFPELKKLLVKLKTA